MMLNPHRERPSHWSAAFALSLALHTAAFLYLTGLVPFGRALPPPPMSFPDISISNIVFEEAQQETLLPEALAAIDPAVQGEAVSPERLAPVNFTEEDGANGVEPETLTAAGPGLDPLEAQPVTEDIAALPTERLNPVAPDAETALQGTITKLQPQTIQQAIQQNIPQAVQQSLPQTVQPERVEAAIAAAPQTVEASRIDPTAPIITAPQPPIVVARPSSPPPPTPEQQELQALIERIRARLGDPCLVALPQLQGAQANPLVMLVSDRDRTMASFTRDVLSDPELEIDQRMVLVDNRQCAALDFARARSTYPSFRLPLSLQATLINSGGELRGSIENITGYYTSLLLVDDNGVVQDLRRFVRFEGGRAEFNVPVTRDGSGRDTSQLLIAVATNGRPATIGSLAGQNAQAFFPALEAEIGNSAAIAVVPFDLR